MTTITIPNKIKNETDAWFFCNWFAENYTTDIFQGWDCDRSEKTGQIWRLRFGNLTHIIDARWAWNERKNINGYIGNLEDGYNLETVKGM